MGASSPGQVRASEGLRLAYLLRDLAALAVERDSNTFRSHAETGACSPWLGTMHVGLMLQRRLRTLPYDTPSVVSFEDERTRAHR